ncbi:MAG: hypothetical protein RL154_298, partial [Pseudomonadota bacterium]
LSLVKAIVITLIVGLCGLFVIFFMVYKTQTQVAQITKDVFEHPFTVINTVRDIRLDARNIVDLYEKVISKNDINNTDSLNEKISILAGNIELKFAIVRKQYLGKQSDVDEAYRAYKELILMLGESQKRQNALEYLSENHFDDKYIKFSDEINDILNFANNKAYELRTQADKAVEDSFRQLAFTIFGMLLISLFVGVYMIRYLKLEFSQIRDFIFDVKHDNYKTIYINPNSLNEFNSIKNALNEMSFTISESNRLIALKNEEIMQTTREVEEINTELDASNEEYATTNAMLIEKTKELELSSVNLASLKDAVDDERLRYKTLMDFASDCIHILDSNGKLIHFSNSFAQMLGYTNEEMRSLFVYDWDYQITASEIRKTIHNLVEAPTTFETKHRAKDGTIIDVEISAKGILLKSELFLYASARNITQRKALENSVRISEDSYKGLFNALRHAVYIQDFNGVFIDVNNGAEEMYGYKRQEFIGKTPEFVAAPDKNDFSKLGQYIMSAKNGIAQRFEFWGMRKNGDIFPKDVSMICGKYFGKDVLITIGVDITKQKDLEQNLQLKVQEELLKNRDKDIAMQRQSRLAAMGEMISNIAHQWRQPLNTLSLKIQDVPMALQFGELNIEYAQSFSKESMAIIQYMSQTIEDFRNFFKPEKEKVHFDVKDSVKKAIMLAKDGLNAMFISLEIEIPDYEINILGYPSEFAQVILIILNNSKDALSEKHGSDRRIRIKLAQENSVISVSICDNAGGIPEDIIDKIFEPYFTTKHQAQGTGLGLYMSKMIVENNMGGKLLVSNGVEGACFRVEYYQ